MICRVCGSTLPDGASFCTSCGTPVSGEQKGGSARQNRTVVCPACGAYCDSNAYACQNCGNILGGQAGGTYHNNTNNAYRPGMMRPKSRILAGVLALIFGSLGIHNFYLGYTNKAVAQLILAFLSCGLVSGIWALVEGIMIFAGTINTDANGIYLE